MARYYLPATPVSCDCQDLISGPTEGVDFYASLCDTDPVNQQIIGITRGAADIFESIVDPGAQARREAAAAAQKGDGGSNTALIVGGAIAVVVVLGAVMMMRR